MRGGVQAAACNVGDGVTAMDIETLYPLVTDAIRHAETMEDIDAGEANLAYRHVSLLEEKIARLLPATDEEGAIARRGAVSAAITAQDYERARHLVDRFLSEHGIDGALSVILSELRTRAQQQADPETVAARPSGQRR
jgi:hypothetical protein